ncbi:MAG: hydrogenase maturation nickel metallochaperone HypA [Planctomycetaceae bacterium]|nr:hydrogenase maturation nickel metallochaperone HypA [Planctomycetaceae bacterium]
MHEQSLVRSLLTQVEQLRIEHGADVVTRVEVEIGPLSGVEPLLVREAFELLVAAEQDANANSQLRPDLELVIHTVPLGCRCRECGSEWSADSCRFVCDHCRSNSVQVISGDEFRLKNITVRMPQQAEVNI